MPDKPRYGSKCNGCGWCCRFQPCPLAAILLNATKGPCPVLVAQRDGTSACGLVVEPQNHIPNLVMERGKEAVSEAASQLIGAGYGCDALDSDQEPMPTKHVRKMMQRRYIRGEIKAWNAREVLGIKL